MPSGVIESTFPTFTPETRTSSPVRFTRGKDMQSLNTVGLFPAGAVGIVRDQIAAGAVPVVRALYESGFLVRSE